VSGSYTPFYTNSHAVRHALAAAVGIRHRAYPFCSHQKQERALETAWSGLVTSGRLELAQPVARVARCG